MTVTVEEEYETVEDKKEEDSVDFSVVIPLIILIVLVVIAIMILVKCYAAKRQTVQITVATKQQLEENGSYQDSQYVFKADDDKSNIFTHQTTSANKLKIADQLSNAAGTENEDQSDAFGDNSGLSNSVSKFSSAGRMSQPISEVNLGDTMKKLRKEDTEK